MEYGLRLRRPDKIPADPRDLCEEQWRTLLPPGALRALYFGTEFCEDLLPQVVEAEQFCVLAQQAGIEAVLLTPIVTPAGLKRVARLLTELGERGWSPTVTFNDWGVLTLLRVAYPRLERKAGRLINRGIRDPRLAQDPAKPSGHSETKGDKLRSLLVRFGVTGVETDADLEGNYLAPQGSSLQRVLHLPYVFAVSGRNCLLKAEATDAENSFSKGMGQDCHAPCLDRCLVVTRSDTKQPLWRAGNTLFYEASEALAARYISRCDRIVLHERPIP